jgi:macrolide-specific efflux system membrane fusion protein
MRSRVAFALLTLALVVAGIVVWTRLGRDEPAPLTAVVERGTIEAAVTATGVLQPKVWVDVGAQVSGQVRSLLVQVGDAVAAGDLVAEIDASVQANRVKASRAGLDAEAALRSAREAAVTLARSEHARLHQLLLRKLTSQTEVDRAANQLAAAESALAELESQIERSSASLASDEAQLSYSRIYAPISGTVVSLPMTVGQTLIAVQVVPTIMRIADLSMMTVQADVSEADVSELAVGTPVYFTTLGSGERRWTGTVRQILPTPNVVNNVVFYPVLFDVPNDDGALLPQMTAQVFFVVATAHDVLRVPVSALSYSGGRADVATVEVVDEDGEQLTREVALGLDDRVWVEVRSGLSEGERIVAGHGADAEPRARIRFGRRF